jgi:Spy/CpxP family protein refolding chaperone
MNNNNTSKVLIILTVIAIAGFGAYAFADWGMGYGRYGMGMHGGGMGYGGQGYMGNLSADEIGALDQERAAFFKATEDLRQDIYAKELELRSELAKQNPDTQKAAKLQKEISELVAQLDRKRVEHVVKMKKINPDAGRGFMERGNMRYGMMGPGMMGRGMMGPGMMGGGMMGPGMMGPGMMGPGMMGGGMIGPGMMGGMMGRGMGTGMMGGGYGPQYGPQYPPQYQQPPKPLEERDAKAILENYLNSMKNPNLKLGKIEDTDNVFEAEIVTKDNSLVDRILVEKSTGWMRSAY